MQPFDYIVPRDHEEASTLLAAGEGRARALQGGTDLLIRMRGGDFITKSLVDLKGLPGMREIRQTPDGWLVIGAACTMNQVATHPLVCRSFDLLAQACNSVASYQLRNRATVGGNCCNASPAADTAPALYCLDGVAESYGLGGTRRMPVQELLISPGHTALAPGQFLTAVHLPPSPLRGCGVFRKLGRTKIGDISIVSVAVYAWETTGESPGQFQWRIALGAVGPTPLRVPEAEAALSADISPDGVALAAELASQAAHPIDDVRASAAYRKAMVRVLTRRGIEAVLEGLKSSA